MLPRSFWGLQRKPIIHFATLHLYNSFDNSLRLQPSQELLDLYREDTDSFRSCTSRKYYRQQELTPLPSPAIPQDTGATSASLTALSRERKASATPFKAHYMYLLLLPVLPPITLKERLGGRWTAHIPFLPQALLQNTSLSAITG